MDPPIIIPRVEFELPAAISLLTFKSPKSCASCPVVAIVMKQIVFVADRPGHDFRYAIDATKIGKELGWKPKISFSKGIEKTFLWYFQNQKYYSNLNKKDINRRIGIKK